MLRGRRGQKHLGREMAAGGRCRCASHRSPAPWWAVSLEAACVSPAFNFQRPLLFSAQSPAEVRPELAWLPLKR